MEKFFGVEMGGFLARKVRNALEIGTVPGLEAIALAAIQ